MKYIPVVLLIAFHLLLLANLQFTAWPEMLSYPYLRNNGYLLYKDMVHPYPPVLTMVLAFVYKLFGYSEIVLKTFTWSLILFSSFLVWLLSKRVTKSNLMASVSLGIYVVTQPLLEGNMLWPDIAIVSPILLGAMFLINKQYLWAGIFLALSGFIKQTGGLFYLSTLAYLIVTKTSWTHIKMFLIGPFIFAVPLLVRLLQEDALQGFLNWVVIYPSLYWSKFPGYVQMAVSKSQALIVTLLVSPLLISGYKNKNREWQILLIFMGLSLISVYPRFSFFHLQSLIAFSAVAFGLAWSSSKQTARIALLACVLLLLWRVSPGARYEWGRETRFLGENDKKLASEIFNNLQGGTSIYLLGLNSNLYQLTNTLPPKPWLDNFGWYLEIPGVQEETLSRWEQNPPQTIFWKKPNSGNWYDLRAYQPAEVVEYINTNYIFEKDLNSEIQIWGRKD